MNGSFQKPKAKFGQQRIGVQTGKSKANASGGGWFLPALGIAAMTAIGQYFTTKSEVRSNRDLMEENWIQQLELEKLRIQAQKELEQMRRTLDPDIYRWVKQQLATPMVPHGGGGGAGGGRGMQPQTRPKAQAFKNFMGLARQGGGMGGGVQRPTPAPAPSAGGGERFNLGRYLEGGRT